MVMEEAYGQFILYSENGTPNLSSLRSLREAMPDEGPGTGPLPGGR